jgi:hypothetical protein
MAAVKLEFQGALRGVKNPLAPHHRAIMVLVAFLLVLHLTYSAKHYALLVPVVLIALVVGTKAGRLLRIAVLSPSKNT